MVHHHDPICNPCPKFLSCSPPETWMLCFVIKRALEAAIIRLMYSIVAAEPAWKAGKMDQKSRTMTFVENYFLIEAYAMDMTDKLGIVKAFSCGASLWARVLFVWALQLNVLFAVVSVFAVMFTQHSLPHSETMTNTHHISLSHFSSWQILRSNPLQRLISFQTLQSDEQAGKSISRRRLKENTEWPWHPWLLITHNSNQTWTKTQILSILHLLTYKGEKMPSHQKMRVQYSVSIRAELNL